MRWFFFLYTTKFSDLAFAGVVVSVNQGMEEGRDEVNDKQELRMRWWLACM